MLRTVFRLLLVACLLASWSAAAAGMATQMPDFKQLERELHLKPSQKAQFDVATVALKRSLLASAGTLMELKTQLAEELMKSNPDWAALLDRQRAAYEINAPIYRETLEEWSRLYALLEDDQVVIAKRFLRDALEGAAAGLR
jgi:hypothetical protein